jgi:hypothetical protein
MTEQAEKWCKTAYPNIFVSDKGRIRRDAYVLQRSDGISRRMPEAFFSGVASPNGYLYVSLKPHRSSGAIHELVATAFLGERPKDARTVNHKDGNKLNNNADNLEWASYKENNRHARKMLLNKQHGELCNLTKFSDDVVDAVRILAVAKRFTYAEIGGFFSMSESHVKEIAGAKSRVRATSR